MIHRTLVHMALAGAALLSPAAAFGEPGEPAFRQATEADLALPMNTAAAAPTTIELSAEAHCGQTVPRHTLIDLSWQRSVAQQAQADPAEAPKALAGDLRVDISKLREGFTTGNFETTGLFSASLSKVTFQAAEPGVRYYWRVLSGGANGWTASPVKRFRAPVCKADVLEADQMEALGLTPAGEEG